MTTFSALLAFGFSTLCSLPDLAATAMAAPRGLRRASTLSCLLLAVLVTLLAGARAECNSAFFTFPAARCVW